MQIDFGTKKVWPSKKSKCNMDPRHQKKKEYQHAYLVLVHKGV
jgi:hypothetical protein